MTNYVNIYCEVIHNAILEDTIFIHGNLASNRWWYPTIEILKNKTNTTKYVGTIVLIGYNFQNISKNKQIDFDRLINEFIIFIKNNKFVKYNLIGHSTGGIIAVAMLLKESNLFNKSLLLNSVGLNGLKIKDNLFNFPITLIQESLNKIIGSVIYQNDYLNDFYLNIIVPDAIFSYHNGGVNISNMLGNIKITKTKRSDILNKVFIVYGRKDKLIHEQDSIDIANLFINNKLVLIDNNGHCLNIENPYKFVMIMNSLLFQL